MLEGNLKDVNKKSQILEDVLLRNDATIASLNAKLLEVNSDSAANASLLQDRNQIAEVCQAQSKTIASLQVFFFK